MDDANAETETDERRTDANRRNHGRERNKRTRRKQQQTKIASHLEDEDGSVEGALPVAVAPLIQGLGFRV